MKLLAEGSELLLTSRSALLHILTLPSAYFVSVDVQWATQCARAFVSVIEVKSECECRMWSDSISSSWYEEVIAITRQVSRLGST